MIKLTIRKDVLKPKDSECLALVCTKKYTFKDSGISFFKTKAYQLDEDNAIDYEGEIDLKSVSKVDNDFDAIQNHGRAVCEIHSGGYKLKGGK